MEAILLPCLGWCSKALLTYPRCPSGKVSKVVGDALADSLESLAHCNDAISLNLIYRYYFGKCSTKFAELVLLHLSCFRSVRYADRRHDFVISILSEEPYPNSIFPCTAKLWNSLPIYCFPLTFNLNFFKTNVNGYSAFLMISWTLFFFPIFLFV